MCVGFTYHFQPIYLTHPTDRVKRLKDARTEAAEEIEAYRKAKEQEFSAFQSSVSPVPFRSSPLSYLLHSSSTLGQHRTHSPLLIRRRRRGWATSQTHIAHIKTMCSGNFSTVSS
jgi:hypothetical protein